MLYTFQKDAVLTIINKLEKFIGCILADSVSFGETFTSLAVMKYYENRNKLVLVLYLKKLANNWNTYIDSYVNNHKTISGIDIKLGNNLKQQLASDEHRAKLFKADRIVREKSSSRETAKEKV